MKKLTLKQHCLIGNVILFLGVGCAIAGAVLRQGGGLHPLIWVAIVLVFGSVVYKGATVLCPHCGRVLPARYRVPATCPHCRKSTEVTCDEETAAEA